MDLCSRLERLLEERELTQRKVAEDLHIARSTMNGYVKGKRQPDYETLIQIARYFDVSVDYLLGVTNIRKNAEGSLSMKEGDLVGIYRSLQADKQDLLLEQALLFKKHDLRQQSRRKRRE